MAGGIVRAEMDTITKTVLQYSEKLPGETIDYLRFLALSYGRVKNYVYSRYFGIRNVGRLTPYYDIMSEMRRCGLREQIGIPVTYYDAAIADAVGDIKGNWGVVKNKIGERIYANDNLNADERKYLRTVLKMNSVYAAVLNRQEFVIPENCKGLNLDIQKLNNLLCRLTRKYLTVPKTDNHEYFGITKCGYSYRDGTIRIAGAVPRQRVVVPVKGNMTSDRQLKIYVKEDYAVIAIPVEVKIREHADYKQTVFIHIGIKDMFTLSNGNVYGKGLDDITVPETERLAKKNEERFKMYNAFRKRTNDGDEKTAQTIEDNNLGKIKYDSQKEKGKARTTTFINTEINRMLRTEKPAKVVITKPVTKNRTNFHVSATNRRLNRGFQGYIRERLLYKCRINSVEVVEIYSKGTGSVCSCCGAEGRRLTDGFLCESCGLKISIPLNCAGNIERKYKETLIKAETQNP